jgi:mycothiol synthase
MEIAELVYMGLIPPARGMGIGGHLLMEAERLTLASGHSKMVIGVDAANAPARKHYEGAGYLVWERKRVFLWLAPHHSR